jgi:hypothetical protein
VLSLLICVGSLLGAGASAAAGAPELFTVVAPKHDHITK